MTNAGWSITTDVADPIIATAIHAGHGLSDELRPYMALDNASRLREEDPFTDRWLSIAGNQVRVLKSRFEVDLNRPTDGAVYRDSADAWGLELWKQPLTDAIVASAMAQYDAFYRELGLLIDCTTGSCGILCGRSFRCVSRYAYRCIHNRVCLGLPIPYTNHGC